MNNQPKRLFLIWAKSCGKYLRLLEALRDDAWTVLIIQNLLSLSRLRENNEESLICLAILSPIDSPVSDEIDAIHAFIARGNLVLLASSASDELAKPSASAILNQISSAYGVIFREDCVIRPNPYKLHHPQETMIEGFATNRGLSEALKRHISAKPSDDSLAKERDGPVEFGARVLYAAGCTMEVDIKQSTIVMTTGKWALPSHQPIGVFHRADNTARLAMLGSAMLLSDQYIDKQDNKALFKSCLEFLANPNFPINMSDARTIEIPEYNLTPDMDRLVQQPVGCLREHEPLPERKSDLIDARLFGLNNSHLVRVMKAYQDLNVAYEPLALMRPKFDWSDKRADGNKRPPAQFLLKRSSDIHED